MGDVLTPTQFAVYDLLRKKRKEIGEKTKIPLYDILSNEQLAHMFQNPPKAKEEFLRIKGVNDQKYKQFGEQFLEAIKLALISAEKVEAVSAAVEQDGTVAKQAKNSVENQNQLDIF